MVSTCSGLQGSRTCLPSASSVPEPTTASVPGCGWAWALQLRPLGLPEKEVKGRQRALPGQRWWWPKGRHVAAGPDHTYAGTTWLWYGAGQQGRCPTATLGNSQGGLVLWAPTSPQAACGEGRVAYILGSPYTDSLPGPGASHPGPAWHTQEVPAGH